MTFARALPIIHAAAVALRPPTRTTVAEAAAKSLRIEQPGGYSGPWSAEEAPYMVEPMNVLASRQHEAECFVGPSRTGKTMALIEGFVTYVVTADPGDTLVLQMSQEKAREFSKSRIDRAIRYSPDLRAMMSRRANDDNTHDKWFVNGMVVKIGWPSASQLASSDYRYVLETDYDRYPDDIDGEGAAYLLGLKRTTTFLSRGMCMVESSPGREITNPNWRPATPHEAPPCTGILGIYNRSDRRRWYWRCPDCGEWFEAKPGLELFATLPPEEELVQMVRKEDLPKLAAHHARVVCPACHVMHGPERKPALNSRGRWLADGLRLVGDRVEGEPLQSSIAGFWLGGVAAGYQSWENLLLRHLQGLLEYELTGSEETLKTSANTDQAVPYLPRAARTDTKTQPSERAEDLPRYVVPAAARFLVASVDVQGGQYGRFVCQVHAVGENMEQWLVDRFDITTSPRSKPDAPVRIDPAGYAEDWDAITAKLVNATYRTGGERELRVRLTVVDTGGEDGVTERAYAWYRRLRAAGLHTRVMLTKGASKKAASQKTTAPVTKITARDARNKPIRDVDLYALETDFFKDVVAASLKRETPGPGYMHFPEWLPAEFYEELEAEVRGPDGKWRKVRTRNESLDLWVMVLGGLWGMQAHRIDWRKPPAWARPIDHNPDSMAPDVRREMKAAPLPTTPPTPAPPRKSLLQQAMAARKRRPQEAL